MINALGNLFFIFLREDRASELFNRLPQCIASASRRHRPHTDGKLEISDLMKLGHLRPILQDAGRYLGLHKLSVPPHGHKEDPHSRFNWLFEKSYYGKVIIVRLFEAGVVDHVVVIDSRRWPSFIYDPCDPFPILCSSLTLFYCGGPDACKVKVRELYEVFRHPRSRENPEVVKYDLLQMPRGSIKRRSTEYNF